MRENKLHLTTTTTIIMIDHFQKEAERRTETDDKDPNDVDENVLRDRDVNLSEEEKKVTLSTMCF